MRLAFAAGLALTLGGCATAPLHPGASLDAQHGVCETRLFRLDADFPSAGMAGCRIVDEDTVDVFIDPEDTPINPSPWYGVKLTPFAEGAVEIVLRYDEHRHRYHPKISSGDGNWIRVSEDDISYRADGHEVTVAVTLDDRPVLLAGQPLLTNEDHSEWMAAASVQSDVARTRIGTSLEGRAIEALETRALAGQTKTVILVGRQHPPEITGAQAMTDFVDEVLGNSALARRFRDHVNLVIVPNLNPDGVAHGHWRHNRGGVDLNRDWGPFTQLETQAMARLIDEVDTDPGREVTLFLDFHSTRRNVFYTQDESGDGITDHFTARWLARARERLPDYAFSRSGSHNRDLPTSKTYMFERFGVPAITYEVGDETDRELIRISAQVFAQEMMVRVLELDR